MNGFILKLIACISMIIDHTAHVLVSPSNPNYLLYRSIGRLAFPIYCFLLVQGACHTRNKKRYLFRMGLFAILSELPYDFALHDGYWNTGYQNVFFTLFIGLLVIFTLEWIKGKYGSVLLEQKRMFYYIYQYGVIFAGCFLADFLRTDYGSLGIILIVVFYMYRENKLAMVLVNGFILLFLSNSVQRYAIISLILIWFYNGKRGPKFAQKKWIQYAFYAYYPLHLMILYYIECILTK